MAKKKQPRRPMSRNRRLAIVLTILVLLILLVPQAVRYGMYATEAQSTMKQERTYINKIARQQQAEGVTASTLTPAVEHWDVNTDGKMKVSISKQAIKATDGRVKAWVKDSAAVWNKALGADVVIVNSKPVDQNDNSNDNIWPQDSDYQLLIGYKTMTNDAGEEDTTVLATTTEAGNMMWVSKHAAHVWTSNRIEREDYLSGAIVGPVTLQDINELHNDEATHTITHEMGHAFGLKHQGTATDLMSPVVGIKDSNVPNKTEIMQVKTILYLAQNPSVTLDSSESWGKIFADTYQQVNGEELPTDLTVINDSHD